MTEPEPPAQTPVLPSVVRTVSELARRLAVARSTAFRWLDAGVPREPDGGFNVAKVDAWRTARFRASRRRGPPALDPKPTRAKTGATPTDRWEHEYRKQKAIKERILVRQLRGTLIAVDKVEQLLVSRAIALKKSLLGLGRRLAPVLVGRDARAIQAAVDEAALEMLEEYSREDGIPRTKPKSRRPRSGR